MRKINTHEELVLGKMYLDSEENDKWATVMKLNKKDGKGVYFEYVSGMECYVKNNDGLIEFSLSGSLFSKGLYEYE